MSVTVSMPVFVSSRSSDLLDQVEHEDTEQDPESHASAGGVVATVVGMVVIVVVMVMMVVVMVVMVV